MSVDLLDGALGALSSKGLFWVEISRYFQTPAFPADSGPDFVNGVVKCETTLDASEVLRGLHEIEARFGRVRKKRWEARVLDLDLIDFSGQIAPNREVHAEWLELPLDAQMEMAPDQLILPHPRVQDRPFVLVPLRDVAPDWVHPVTEQSVDEMVARFSAAELSEIRPLAPAP